MNYANYDVFPPSIHLTNSCYNPEDWFSKSCCLERLNLVQIESLIEPFAKNTWLQKSNAVFS